jgi:hypothetical protein
VVHLLLLLVLPAIDAVRPRPPAVTFPRDVSELLLPVVDQICRTTEPIPPVLLFLLFKPGAPAPLIFVTTHSAGTHRRAAFISRCSLTFSPSSPGQKPLTPLLLDNNALPLQLRLLLGPLLLRIARCWSRLRYVGERSERFVSLPFSPLSWPSTYPPFSLEQA